MVTVNKVWALRFALGLMGVFWPLPATGGTLTAIDVDTQSGALVLRVSEAVTPRVAYLSRPERMVIDLPDTKVGAVGKIASGVTFAGVRRVRSAQYTAQTARVVLDLDGRQRFDYVTLGNRVELRPAAVAKPVAQPVAPVVSKARRLADLARARWLLKQRQTSFNVAQDNLERVWRSVPMAPLTLKGVRQAWQLRLMATGDYRHEVIPLSDTRIKVRFKGGRIALPRDSVYIDNGLIARVRLMQSGRDEAELMIDFDKPVDVQHKRLADSRALLLSMKRIDRDRVTLDPGHGGDDNGAVGTAGTREKDVTLGIAERLSKVMQRHGMSVQMTRMRDLEILLRPRVDMANRDESDVFVSIHANSMGRHHQIRGIETYYYSDESYPLARAIHQQLVTQLKQPDRGVRKNNFYVVHHTKMPAALVEIGYLSNPQEEALIRDPVYQERAAQAIFDGVQAFLRERNPKH
jgi:N-acetylmuramoyl-L-alanine amidase CwlD